jgi:hypothetical protein
MAVKLILSMRSKGSLIPLSFGFFLISLTLIFISINIGSAYAAKRELTNIGESAIQRSAHEIDKIAYYFELNRFTAQKRVPINCNQARDVFFNLISSSNISGKQIYINSFQCNIFEVKAEISITGRLPIDIPFQGMNIPKSIEITASVGANSPYQLP